MKDSSKDIKAKDLPKENQKESPRGNLEDASRECQKENPRSRSDERNCDSAQVVTKNISAQPLTSAEVVRENISAQPLTSAEVVRENISAQPLTSAEVVRKNISAHPLTGAEATTENSITETPLKNQKPNLYSSAKVSVKVLDMAIVVLIGILVLVFVYLTSKPGLTIYFDTDGGSRVENAQYLHGEALTQPTAPVKEGYSFTGWYKDQDCTQPWDFSKDRVEQSFTLYAGWEKKT